MKYNKKEVINIIGLVLVMMAAFFFLRYWPVDAPTRPTPPVSENPEPNQTTTDLKSQKEVAESINRFAFDLYSLYREQKGNIFFSPYSITTALAMTHEGARGETAQEMEKVFYLPSQEVRHPGFQGLYQNLNRSGSGYELSAANALWPEQSHSFRDDYFELVEHYYGGRASRLDFRNQPEQSRLTINRWVEQKTKDKIKDLIPAGLIDSLTRLVLTSAIYFKGSWLREFDPDLTRSADFYPAQGGSAKVPMMVRTDDEAIFDYFETDDLQVVSLPYRGEELAMTILLPKQGKLENFEAGLDYEKIISYRPMLSRQRVDLFLPRFKFETKYFMADDLAAMGMPLAFTGRADFSGITGQPDLYISSVIHQAFVEVNEEGTEAAAATGVIMKEVAMMQVPVFKADRPFIFLIEHLATGTILFMGRVSDPSGD